MKIIAIIDNVDYDSKLLIEINASEMEQLTGLDKNCFKKSTKDLVGQEYDVTSIIATNKLIQNFALGDEYSSVLSNQKKLLNAMERLQKPMINIREQLKQIK